jgi:hypothetical protein
VLSAASGTTIRHFVFDGRGFSDTNPSDLSIAITGSANDVVVEANNFLGAGGGLSFSGSGWQVSHNVFEGFTMLSDCTGGWGVLFNGASNVVTHNSITATVPEGDFSPCSWIAEVDVPFVGIITVAEDGAVITNNKIAIASNSSGDAGAGIIATDFGDVSLATSNLVITDNDGRKSAYALIITRDGSGGSANTAGAVIRGNLGVNLINSATADVTNRSIHTSEVCDSGGVCQPAH